MDDLAAWLTQIWDEQEKTLLQITHEGDRPHWPGCQFPGDVPGYCNCDLTEQMLARIAADRQILALATKTIADAPERGYDWESEHARAQAAAYEQVIRLLALPHADHPGYQEAWKPE